MFSALKRNALAAAALFFLAAGSEGASFTVLHAFTNSTGASPGGAMLLSSNLLYGTTGGGGSGGNGTLFKAAGDGTDFTNFYNFTPRVDNTNSDGQGPGSLILSSNTFYGITSEGGPHGGGTVFKVNMDGSGFKTLRALPLASANSNGYHGGVIALSDNFIFGTTTLGGPVGHGTVFRINTDGSSYTNLLTNSARQLLVISNTLYGIMDTPGSGSIFQVNPDGSGFTNVYQFSLQVANGVGFGTNSDGAAPGQLAPAGGVFYGVAAEGGGSGNGTLFKLKLDGSGFATLYSFSATPQYVPGSNTVSDLTNYDGAGPDNLVVCGNTLYGAASGGGMGGVGTLFKLNTDGTGFTTLYNMSSLVWFTNVVGTTTYITFTNNDGLHPGGLLLWRGTLYGTADSGGGGQVGTLFDLSVPQPLNESVSGQNLILQWDDASFSLQTAPTPQGPWSNVAGATSPYTNSLAGPLQFFRLQAD